MNLFEESETSIVTHKGLLVTFARPLCVEKMGNEEQEFMNVNTALSWALKEAED